MKTLLFFDVDGTLIDDSHRLVPSVRPAMARARENGHILFINTGRTLCNMDDRLAGLPLDGWVMGCGTRVIYRGETLQSMEYGPEPSLGLREVFLKLRIPTVYECDTAMYFDPSGPAHPLIGEFRRFAERRGIARDIGPDDPEFRAVKMFCFSESREAVREIEKRTAEAGMPYTGIDRSPLGWEIVPAGYSKGTGIRLLCEKLGVDAADCFAFGDSRNDLAMLESVGHSVAMGNAPEDVKAVCSHVTARPEDDGILKAFRHFGLI